MGRGTSVNSFAEGVELFESSVPFAREDIASKFSPVSGYGKIRVGREYAEVVEVVGSSTVVTIGILELAKVV